MQNEARTFFTTENRAVCVILEKIQNRAISRSVLFEAMLYEALLYVLFQCLGPSTYVYISIQLPS